MKAARSGRYKQSTGARIQTKRSSYHSVQVCESSSVVHRRRFAGHTPGIPSKRSSFGLHHWNSEQHRSVTGPDVRLTPEREDNPVTGDGNPLKFAAAGVENGGEFITGSGSVTESVACLEQPVGIDRDPIADERRRSGAAGRLLFW